MSARHKFRPSGIIVPIVTPFTRETQTINSDALRKLVRCLVEAGVHGIVSPGSTGEFYALEDAEKKEVMEMVVDEVDHRIPVWGGTGAVSTRKAIELTQAAERIGVDAAMVISPFYIVPNEDELLYHYEAISGSTNLPIVIYSNPKRTHVHHSKFLIGRLAQIDNIVGIKDSSGDLVLTAEYVRATLDDFCVLTGHDPLILSSLVQGASGAVSATANIFPGLAVGIYQDFVNGNFETAQEKQRWVTVLHQILKLGTFPAGIKKALELVGVEAGPARYPVKTLSTESRACLRAIIKQVQDVSQF